MNHYEAKQEERRHRLACRAQKLQSEASHLNQQASQMASIIPMGQPILVGHHSEGRDRRYRERISNTFSKAHEKQQEAQEAARRAETIGTGGISSDDPDAQDKLQEKLAKAEAEHAVMVGVNKIIRGNRTAVDAREKTIQAILDVYPRFSRAAAEAIMTPNCFGAIGFADYQLKNSNARIKQMKARIQVLEAKKGEQDVEEVTDRYTYREDTELNRAMFIFPGKPAANIISSLKQWGFRWAPSNGAWQAQLNNRARYAAKMVRRVVDGE